MVNQALQQHNPSPHQTNVEDGNSTGDIQGFEDIDDYNSDQKQVEEVQETPSEHNSSRSKAVKGTVESKGSSQQASSRTRTAPLSQNGYSEELL